MTKESLDTYYDELGTTLGEALIAPTKIYVKTLQAARHVSERARIAVEIAGKDLTEENRQIFYEALDRIVENLRILAKDGIPEER